MPIGGSKIGFFGAGAGDLNYWGDGSDGAFTSDGSDTQTVQNKNGSFDGDILVRNYTSMNVQSGHTYTVDQPCRGMLIYVDGDCTIAGTLTKSSKGGFADAESAGGSDSAAANSNGLQLGFIKDGSTESLAAPTFAGGGNAAVSAVANHPAVSSDGINLRIKLTGGALGPGGDANHSWMGRGGGNGDTGGVTISTGGGQGGDRTGGGCGGGGGTGGKGQCFSGGPGGGSGQGDPGGNAANNHGGGAGGNAGPEAPGGGGAGNPTGSMNNATNQGEGVGGIIYLVVKGDLTVSGTISSNGVRGGSPNSGGSGGGGSGAGAIFYVYAGTLSNTGTIEANGGTPGRSDNSRGGGGEGGIYGVQVDE